MRKYRNWIGKFFSLILFVGVYFLCSKEVQGESIEEKSLKQQLADVISEGEIHEVSQKGDGDFSSIQEAVNCAKTGDTILIYPGIYEEHVEIYNKEVTLFGVNRELCVIKYDSSKYNVVPLTISAGKVMNLSIYGYRPDDAQGVSHPKTSTMLFSYESDETLEEWQSKFPGYAVHIDENYSYGKELFFYNCKIVSNNSQCVGIGSRGNAKYIFEKCDLFSNGTGGCIYFHNTADGMYAGETQFVMKECNLKNYACPYVMVFHSLGDNNLVSLTFQNNSVSTIAYERKGSYNSTNMNVFDGIYTINNQGELESKIQRDASDMLQLQLISRYTEDESKLYMRSVRKKLSLFDEEPQINKGITYIQMTETKKEYLEIEEQEEVKNRKRQIIDIYNNSQCIGNGWCGLESIYLSEESYGNTLVEMNYSVNEAFFGNVEKLQ